MTHSDYSIDVIPDYSIYPYVTEYLYTYNTAIMIMASAIKAHPQMRRQHQGIPHIHHYYMTNDFN